MCAEHSEAALVHDEAFGVDSTSAEERTDVALELGAETVHAEVELE